jgi:hypothetical protein
MHNARTGNHEDDTDLPDPEPEVLSYTQFRNHLGLLEWKRRRAQYEQGRSPAAQWPRTPWLKRASDAVNRL